MTETLCLQCIGHVVAIKAECFALICGQCLEQLSDRMRMRPLGTCKKEDHIKVHSLTVQKYLKGNTQNTVINV